MNTGELLTKLHALMGVIDKHNTELSALKKARKSVEGQLQKIAEEQGVDSLSNNLISVTLKEDFIAAYDPDFWPELIKWAGDTGNSQIVQRRISTKPIQELIDNGCELPVGVRLEPQTKVLVRRK